ENPGSAMRSGSGRPQELLLSSLLVGQDEGETESSPEPAAEEPDETPAESEGSADSASEVAKESSPEEEAPAVEDEAKPSVAITTTESTDVQPAIGTSVELNFPQSINHGTLRDRIQSELKELGQPETYFTLD